MASKSLSNEQRAGRVGAIGSLVLISPPAAACATVGWVAHEAMPITRAVIVRKTNAGTDEFPGLDRNLLTKVSRASSTS